MCLFFSYRVIPLLVCYMCFSLGNLSGYCVGWCGVVCFELMRGPCARCVPLIN